MNDKPKAVPVGGQHIVVGNGSVAVIEKRAKVLADHALVRITVPRGHHKLDDVIVWEIPETLIAQLARAAEQEKAAA